MKQSSGSRGQAYKLAISALYRTNLIRNKSDETDQSQGIGIHYTSLVNYRQIHKKKFLDQSTRHLCDRAKTSESIRSDRLIQYGREILKLH